MTNLPCVCVASCTALDKRKNVIQVLALFHTFTEINHYHSVSIDITTGNNWTTFWRCFCFMTTRRGPIRSDLSLLWTGYSNFFILGTFIFNWTLTLCQLFHFLSQTFTFKMLYDGLRRKIIKIDAFSLLLQNFCKNFQTLTTDVDWLHTWICVRRYITSTYRLLLHTTKHMFRFILYRTKKPCSGCYARVIQDPWHPC